MKTRKTPRIEDPPATERGRSSSLTTRAVAFLHDHPGQWAAVRTYSNHNSAHSFCQLLKKKNPGIETTVRRLDESAVVYARLVETS